MFEGDITTDGVWLNGTCCAPARRWPPGRTCQRAVPHGHPAGKLELTEQGLAQTAPMFG